MKRLLIILLLMVSAVLVSCGKEIKINAINDVNEFDNLITEEGVLLYDIRLSSVCEEGHIPYFMCMGPAIENEGYDSIASNIATIYPDLNKKIVLIGEDDIVIDVLNELKEKGYKNLYYYVGGYNKYANDKGPDFVPSVGCDC